MFAIGRAQGKSQAQAYRDAGYGDSGANASTLQKRPEVQARIDELIEERTKFRSTFVDNNDLDHLAAVDDAMKSGEISRAWVIKELMDNVKLARDANQFSASNQALKMLGEEIGMFQVKSKDPTGGKDGEEKEPALPVDVGAINKLLTKHGYNGPTIDLTMKSTPEPVPLVTHDLTTRA